MMHQKVNTEDSKVLKCNKTFMTILFSGYSCRLNGKGINKKGGVTAPPGKHVPTMRLI